MDGDGDIGRRRDRLRVAVAGLSVLLAAAACSSPNQPHGALPATSVTTPAASSPQSLAVTSTLDGKSRLPVRVSWQAHLDGSTTDVAEVDFLIDGRLSWVEHNSPYVYGSEGSVLVTSFLPPGRHTFTVRAVDLTGHPSRDDVTATTVAPPPPPAVLAGTTWARQVNGGQDTGRWTISVTNWGWHFGDPHGGGENQDVSYPAAGRVLIRAAIVEPPYGGYPYGGAFCDEAPDPTASFSYRLSANGQQLTFESMGRDACIGGMMTGGTWQRVH
jgi:hypothetical protein